MADPALSLPGVMRHRVTIRRRTPDASNGGVPVPIGPVVLWERIAAHVQQGAASNAQRVFVSQVLATMTHMVTTRGRQKTEPVQIDDEIVWHDGAVDRVLRVQSVQGDAVNAYVALAVKEIPQ